MKRINFQTPVYAAMTAATNWNDEGCAVDNIATIKGIECLVRNVLLIVIPITGLVFFAMLIVGGFKLLTASGDPKKASAATSTITKAVIGVVGVILSWLILTFIKNFTGVDVTNLEIPN